MAVYMNKYSMNDSIADITEAPLYGNSEISCFVLRYLRDIILVRHPPNDVVGIIVAFCGSIVSFTIFNSQHGSFETLQECCGIYVNKSTVSLMDLDNRLHVFGANNYYQLGFDSRKKRNSMHELEWIIWKKRSFLHEFFKDKCVLLCSTGMNNDWNFIQTSDGLYAMGWNAFNQCGIKTTQRFIPKPRKIECLSMKLKLIKCGRMHSLFLTINGNIFGCGDNRELQLTHKYYQTNKDNIIQCIIDTNNIASIDCSADSSYVFDANHKLMVFGSNKYGQLGINNPSIKHSSIIDFNSTEIDVNRLSCGRCHIGCLTHDNKLYMFGSNSHYQCGLKNKYKCCVGYEISLNNERIVSVKCGPRNTIIKTDKNHYYSFGNNANNVLLLDTQKKRVSKPTLITSEYIHKITQSNNDVMDILPSNNGTYIIQKSS
mmetsp:Transcript_94310/g.115488  ORF Transcript_94310/g.115488 Transcript_94310/m.115488 type:complete len:429 (+) Transcript_94310:40-1326(+)